MTAVYAGPNNAYVPSHESSRRLTVDYARDPKKFPLNRYIQLFPVDKMVGYYAKFNVADRMRITDTNAAKQMWKDGADAPRGDDFGEKFEWLLYECKRYMQAGRIGWLTAQQNSLGLVQRLEAQLAQFMMTLRTQRVLTMLQTSGNWPTANTIAVSSITGVSGKWDVSTTARSDIQRSINYAMETIFLATGGAVEMDQLALVVPRKSARLMSTSQEIRDYIKGGPDAKPWIIGKDSESWNNKAHGLPDYLFGIEVIVENAVKMTSARGITDARAYVADYTAPFIVAKPEKLVGVAGEPSFATAALMSFSGESSEGNSDSMQDLQVEHYESEEHKRTHVRVIDNTAEKLPAGESGFLFTAAIT